MAISVDTKKQFQVIKIFFLHMNSFIILPNLDLLQDQKGKIKIK